MDSRNLPNRKSIRLQSYDYAHPGYYFVTMCSYQKECIFGEIRDGIMHQNSLGNIAMDEWHRTESIRDNVKMDAFVVMPNHVHGIIQIIDPVGAYRNTPPPQNRNTPPHKNRQTDVRAYRDTPLPMRDGKSLQSPSNNLGAIVRGYKSVVTKRINSVRKTPGFPVWQRNYYEHIIRDETALFNIRKYIEHNPRNWEQDNYF